MRRYVLASIIALLTIPYSQQSSAAADPDPDPLFASHEALTVHVHAPFGQIMKERPDDKEDEVAGRFSLVSPDGSQQEFALKILTRGNSRRDPDICPFPPLRLNFRKGELDGTLLAGQDKLKLVTHCVAGRKPYQQTVIREYLAYRILNIMTEASFRVRLLKIVYDYSDDDEQEQTYAFVVESKHRLAKRTSMATQDVPFLHIESLDRQHTNLVSVFAYLIGNVDFSPIQGQSDENCCHNASVFSPDGETYWSIPYDFDMTGLVEPRHVRLNPRYRQTTIRQRIYRGRCINNDLLPTTLRQFRDQRSKIEALVTEQPDLSNRHRKRVASYIESFYDLLDKEDMLIERFEAACIG